MSLTAAAAIGAGASFLGNIFGAKSQHNANEANYKIAQMNNEWSEKMMQKQMDYNTMMWNKQNEYNDPKNQVARLQGAGINPALALSNISTGSATGASSPSLPSPSGATMQPFRPDFSGIGSSLMSAYQLEGVRKQQDAQARFMNTQSDWYAAKAAADIGKIVAETKSHTAKTYWQNVQNQYAQGFAYEGYMKEMRARQTMEVQIHNSIKQGILMDKEISRYDEVTNAKIADLAASVGLKYAQGELTKEQLKRQIEEIKGIKLSNKEKEAIFDYVVDKADADRFKGYTPFTAGLDALYGVSNRIMNFFRK